MIPPHTDLSRIRDTLLQGHSFLLTSHARPDGDSLGSQLALAGALQQLGKQVRIINRDPVPAQFAFLAGVSTIEIAAAVQEPFDVVVVLECSDLSRAGVAGLEGRVLINIDHHAGNVMYGDINWHDVSACACAEMVFELIEAIGARLTPALATHVYVAILTDTGSFRHAHITARTFEICRRIAQTGIDVAGVAAQIYNNTSVGRLRLIGMLLDRMQLEHDGRIAVLSLNDTMLAETGCASDDLEGIVNLPLAARNVRVVIFIKEAADGLRVSLRSKNAIDIREVAVFFGGGGHLNAAGFTIEHPTPESRGQVIAQVTTAISDSDT